MKAHGQWIEAAKSLVMNPHSQVLRANCGVAFLRVEDERLDDEHIDRHLKCTSCGAHETVLKRLAKEPG